VLGVLNTLPSRVVVLRKKKGAEKTVPAMSAATTIKPGLDHDVKSDFMSIEPALPASQNEPF
jgi:hypothetical protein